MQSKEVPYFSQWESPGMTLPLMAEGPSALYRDPLWRNSGAETVEDYARWAVNVCGMACLKMILAVRGEIHPTLDLARACTAYGGYVVNEADGSIKGLIYEPFVKFVRERFSLSAETMTNIDVGNLPDLLSRRRYFIASVHPGIRRPDEEPPSKGGHLVLVTAASPSEIRFHNPSGHDRQSRANVTLPLASFDRFFARRGIAVDFQY
ncbi:C39 family peptidase [Mesorhizobium sp. VK25A]|uniref:C39 family peptidase n=1 Tax=Mesorhizobium vachelliae TaxID=3072309 RepID=A0ABU4ZZN4_9HYPH|nr:MULTISPECIES: C39 family peptidase [unclassified Mesorhizobium]MDX8530883.1 C39 family peptidase [Mesorhizobium sp. VK25D]MDX8543366.1 C39 family peptidase [Mesorhizobium sp. VK25A]